LKAAIEKKAVDMVGTHTTTHAVGGLEDLDTNAGCSQGSCTGQTGESSSNDHNVFVHALHATDCSVLTC
jgi:hypothetical protein